MKKFIVPIVAASFVLVSSPSFCQADIEINWQNPEKYRDVRPTTESRSRFRDQTFTQLEEYLQKLAKQLPDGQKLLLNVTNLLIKQAKLFSKAMLI
jgi:hypothetical protein